MSDNNDETELTNQVISGLPANMTDSDHQGLHVHPERILEKQKMCNPLKESHIRVLCLEAGAFDKPLRGRMLHLNLGVRGPHRVFRLVAADSESQLPEYERQGGDDNTNAPHPDQWRAYECLSYAWGEPAFSEKLYIIGHGVVKITPSLHSALQYLRYSTEVRWLWADAICINQQDNEERSAQVARMAQIYADAAKALVWPGPGKKTDALVLATMHAWATTALSNLYLSQDSIVQVCEKSYQLQHGASVVLSLSRKAKALSQWGYGMLSNSREGHGFLGSGLCKRSGRRSLIVSFSAVDIIHGFGAT